MTIRTNTAGHPALLDEAPLRQARNSAAFWAATGRSRGHEVIRRRGFLVVAGDERAGLRILIHEADLAADEVAEIADLARDAAGPVDAEDPFSATDLRHLGLRSWQMPVMLRRPGPVAEPAMEVIRVRREADLHAAERAVIGNLDVWSTLVEWESILTNRSPDEVIAAGSRYRRRSW